MSQPLKRFATGDPVTKVLNKGFLNTVVDRLNSLGRTTPTQRRPEGPLSTVECYVINNTSGAFPIQSVVAVQSSLPFPVSTAAERIRFQSEPVFSIDVPAASTDFPIICLEPIPANGGVGRAAIGGIAVCTVNVTDAGHEYANPTPTDETRLTSAATGQARILWKDTGTGNKTAVVYLVEPSGTSGSSGPSVTYLSGTTGSLPQVIVPANSVAKVQCTFHITKSPNPTAGLAEAWFELSTGGGIYGTSYTSWAFNVSPETMPHVPLVSTFDAINSSGSSIILDGFVTSGWGPFMFSGTYFVYPYP